MNLNRWSFVSSAVISALTLGLPDAQAQLGLTPGLDLQPYQLGDRLIVGTHELSDNASTSSLIKSEELTANQISSPRDLTTSVPGLAVFDANGDRVPRFSIRGLRENNFSVGEAAMTLYVDDVPYTDLFSRGVLLDRANYIEVYRGPHGTRFGSSRPGGVINVLTRLPNGVAEAHAKLRLGNYETINTSVGVSGPVVANRLFFGLDGLFASREGYFRNLVTGTHPDSRETLAGRAQLRWLPSESFEATATFAVDRFHDGYIPSIPFSYTGDRFDSKTDFDGYNRQRSLTESIRMAWTGEWVKIVSVTTRRDWRQDLLQDFDFQEYGLPVNAPVPFAKGFTKPKVGQWAQELRLESTDGPSKWSWLAGGYVGERVLDNNSGSHLAGLQAPPPINFIPGPFTDRTTAHFRDLNFAAFGEVKYQLWEKLDIIGGIRFEWDERKMDRLLNAQTFAAFGFPANYPVKAERDFASVQPRAGLEYRFNKDASAYFNFSLGYQPGGLNLSNNNPLESDYDAAESQHYEVGTRARWMDGKVRADLSLFLTETRDYQVYRAVTQTEFEMVNAQKARSYGAEAEVSWVPCKYFEFAVNGGYANAEFTRFTGNFRGKPFDYSDRDINFVPEFTLGASATWRHTSGAFARLGARAVGNTWFDEENSNRQSAYALMDARIGWENGKFSVTAFGRNLLDKEYWANAIDFRTAGLGLVGTPGDPMLLGVEAAVKF